MAKPTHASPPDETILHVDMNAFFVSVEVRENPKLAGLPVVVGGAGPRGVIAAASYEARVFGVRSAMPGAKALRLCPKAVFLAGNFALYKQVSRNIMTVFRELTPVVEPLSLDEAFLDVSTAFRVHGDPAGIAQKIRTLIFEREKLLCTVGVAASKSVAKLASEAAKPKIKAGRVIIGSGIKIVRKVDEANFLRPLPVGALWGVGPKTQEKLLRLGLKSVGDLADLSLGALSSAVGEAHGQHLHDMANGVDSRRVEPNRVVKSISRETTFAVDVDDRDRLHLEIVGLSDSVASNLRRLGFRARTVTVKARYGDFETLTRSKTIDLPTSNALTITEFATELLGNVEVRKGIRLVGVGVKGLVEGSFEQLSFANLAEPSAEGERNEVDAVVDEVRRKFGDRAIGSASLAAAQKRQDPSSEAPV